ncbi:MAG: hypothetical protein HS117_17550 [Verrucomicrobiaceae bacterium]|nr:hypothetical protein [Verrucomicrobiaceae bacterium]
MPPRRLLSSAIICLFPWLAACVSPESNARRQARAALLARDLQSLDPGVSTPEAEKLATAAVERAHELNRRWKPARMAWMNNLFVNTGLRGSGLCYQWREAMYPALHHLRPRTLVIHLASARRATLREHNAIVITARGQAFDDGIVLDAWRSGGILKWSRVRSDAYPWKPLPWELTPVELRPLIMPGHR